MSERTSTVAPKILAARAATMERLADHVAQTQCCEVIGHDRTRAGGDPVGRFVVLAQGDDGARSELTRCSSRERAAKVAETHVLEGWMIHGLYDLDRLKGEAPTIGEGDEVLDQDGVWREVTELDASWAADFAEHGRNTVCWETEDEPGFMYTDEVDYDGGVRLAEPDERLPVKYATAGVKVVVHFDSVAR